MANYSFPQTFNDEIINPTVTVSSSVDHWDGTCTVTVLLTTPNSNQAFTFPDNFTYISKEPTHGDIEAWVLIQLLNYEI